MLLLLFQPVLKNSSSRRNCYIVSNSLSKHLQMMCTFQLFPSDKSGARPGGISNVFVWLQSSIDLRLWPYSAEPIYSPTALISRFIKLVIQHLSYLGRVMEIPCTTIHYKLWNVRFWFPAKPGLLFGRVWLNVLKMVSYYHSRRVYVRIQIDQTQLRLHAWALRINN